ELNSKIDALGRAVGCGRSEDVLLTQDRRLAVNEQSRALVGIGDDAIADDQTFAGLELDLEGHGRPRIVGAGVSIADEQKRRAEARLPVILMPSIRLRTGGAPPGRPARPSRGPSRRAAGGSGGPAGWRRPRWCRPGESWRHGGGRVSTCSW